MKEYKIVHLNKDIKLSTEKEMDLAAEVINKYVAEGWTLQQVETLHGLAGTLIGVFYKEN